MVDGASGSNCWASDGHRLVTRVPGAEPQAGRSTRCELPRCRPDQMAAAADLCCRVLLLLALSRAAVTIFGLLVPGWALPRAGGSGVSHRQSQRVASDSRDRGPLRHPTRRGSGAPPVARREGVPGRRGLLRAGGVAVLLGDEGWTAR